MKKIDPGQTIAILANLGVIAGIVLLAVEMQQNNRLLRAQAIASVLDTRMFVTETNLLNEDIAEFFVRNRQEGEPLSAVEAFRVSQGNQRVIEGYERDLLLYDAGVLPKDLLLDWLPRMQQSFANPWPNSASEVWERYRSVATPRFIEFVESCLIEVKDCFLY